MDSLAIFECLEGFSVASSGAAAVDKAGNTKVEYRLCLWQHAGSDKTKAEHMTNHANETKVTFEGDNTFRVSLSELDLSTLCFVSHCVKFQEHDEAGRPFSEYHHETADASSIIARTLDVLLEGVRRNGAWENALLDLVFPYFDDFCVEAYNEYLWSQEESLQERLEELEKLAFKAETEGREEESDRLDSEVEQVEKEIEKMTLAIKAAEKLSRNPGLD
jgi:hypothetical protein